MKVLVPLDGSEVAECVLPVVDDWAKKLDWDITLLRVVTFPGPDWPGGEAAVTVEETEVKEYLKQAYEKLAAKGLKVATATKAGSPAEVIVDYAAKEGYGLIAMSTHGRSGIASWVMGSVTNKVLTVSTVPVLVVRGQEAKEQLAEE